jgi:hypothetical protein
MTTGGRQDEVIDGRAQRGERRQRRSFGAQHAWSEGDRTVTCRARQRRLGRREAAFRADQQHQRARRSGRRLREKA